MLMVDYPLPYYNERRNGAVPKYVIIHYTDTSCLEETVKVLNENELSSHYCIDENGFILKFVDEDKRAWHAGKSYWNGLDDMNSHSIGIEIQNPGHSYGHRSFTNAQIKSITALVLDIMKRNNIPAKNVIGHSDVAPDRKQDPGYLFPWKDLAKQGASIWPEVTKENIEEARRILNKETKVKRIFKQIGYAPTNQFDIDAPKFEDIIKAFQLRFEPELFTSSLSKQKIGKLSVKTIALALALTEIIENE